MQRTQKEKLKAVLRRDKKYKDPLIFLIDVEANYGNILTATVEGHVEASLGYYRENTEPAEWSPEFERLGYSKDELELKKRLHYRTLKKIWH